MMLIFFVMGCFMLDSLPEGLRPTEPAKPETEIIILDETEPQPTVNRTGFCSAGGGVENEHFTGRFCLSPSDTPIVHRAQNEHFVWVVTP